MMLVIHRDTARLDLHTQAASRARMEMEEERMAAALLLSQARSTNVCLSHDDDPAVVVAPVVEKGVGWAQGLAEVGTRLSSCLSQGIRTHSHSHSSARCAWHTKSHRGHRLLVRIWDRHSKGWDWSLPEIGTLLGKLC
jgi:hypothetical protein